MFKLIRNLMVMGAGAVALLWIASVAGVDIDKSIFKQTRSVVDKQITLSEVQKLAQLTTASQVVTGIKEAGATNDVFGITTGVSSVTYSGAIEILAGLNLDKLTLEDIQFTEDGKTIIQLPAPEILRASVVPNQSSVITEGSMGFAPGNQGELIDQVQEELLNEARAAACDNGILQSAQEKAESVIRNWPGLASKNLEIQFEKQTNESCYSGG